jgi:hypothetical protein
MELNLDMYVVAGKLVVKDVVYMYKAIFLYKRIPLLVGCPNIKQPFWTQQELCAILCFRLLQSELSM